jgi:hypothetical protein
MGARRYHTTRSELKRLHEQHARALARKHTHICESCPDDTPYVCTGAPCQRSKKKLCKDCRRLSKYHGATSATPMMDFEAPPMEAVVGEYADYADFMTWENPEAGTLKPILLVPPHAWDTFVEGLESEPEVIDALKPKPTLETEQKVLKNLCNKIAFFTGYCTEECNCVCHKKVKVDENKH